MRLMEFLFTAALISGAGPALAQAPDLRELCVDRPGKDTPPCIVDKGHAILEFGTVRFAREDGVSQYDLGETLIRVGLTDTIEAQLDFTPYSIVRFRDPATGRRTTVKGAGDLTGAVKVNLLNPDGSGTSVAAQLFVTAPTGKDGIGAGGWEGGLIIPLSFELSDKVQLTLNPELDIVRNESGGGTHFAYVGVASLSRDLGGGFEGSAEIWTLVDHDPAGHSTQASFDLSMAWTPEQRPNLQFDAEVDIGLTDATPGIEATAGIAYRF